MDKERILNEISRWTNTGYMDSVPFVLKMNECMYIAWFQLAIIDNTDHLDLSFEVCSLFGMDSNCQTKLLKNINQVITVSTQKDDEFTDDLTEEDYYDQINSLFVNNFVTKKQMEELLIIVFPPSMFSLYKKIIDLVWED